MLRFSFMVLCVLCFQAVGAVTSVDCGCWPWLRSSRVRTYSANPSATGTSNPADTGGTVEVNLSGGDTTKNSDRKNPRSFSDVSSQVPWRDAQSGSKSPAQETQVMQFNLEGGVSLSKYVSPYVVFLRSLIGNGVMLSEQDRWRWIQQLVQAIYWIKEDRDQALLRDEIQSQFMQDVKKPVRSYNQKLPESLAKAICPYYGPFNCLILSLICDHTGTIPNNCLQQFIRSQIYAMPIAGLHFPDKELWITSVIGDLWERCARTDDAQRHDTVGANVTSALALPYPVNPGEFLSAQVLPDTGAGVGPLPCQVPSE